MKIYWKIFILTVVAVALSTAIGSASAQKISFLVNSNEVLFNNTTGIPYMSAEGRVMVPIRASLDAIGCSVDWDQASKTVTVQRQDITIAIPVGQNEILINKSAVPSDSPAVIIEGRTYMPLRAVLEACGYAVEWHPAEKTVHAKELTAFNINGGRTGIFQRKQLAFSGFSGIEADITLPLITLGEKGDCPYVYFGFDWASDQGNGEGGFQFIEDQNDPLYNQWTVFMRQGNEWRWGNQIALEQGSTHHLKLYAESRADTGTDLVIELDGKEVVRKKSTVDNFQESSVKSVIAMGMTKQFDGQNCTSRSEYAKVVNLKVAEFGSKEYKSFDNYKLYSQWRPQVGQNGMWYGSSNCVPSYLHDESDGSVSIYKD